MYWYDIVCLFVCVCTCRWRPGSSEQLLQHLGHCRHFQAPTLHLQPQQHRHLLLPPSLQTVSRHARTHTHTQIWSQFWCVVESGLFFPSLVSSRLRPKLYLFDSCDSTHHTVAVVHGQEMAYPDNQCNLWFNKVKKRKGKIQPSVLNNEELLFTTHVTPKPSPQPDSDMVCVLCRI